MFVIQLPDGSFFCDDPEDYSYRWPVNGQMLRNVDEPWSESQAQPQPCESALVVMFGNREDATRLLGELQRRDRHPADVYREAQVVAVAVVKPSPFND